MTCLKDRLSERSVLIADGATGTMLQAAGLPPDVSPERWNLERPEAIHVMHQAYVEAGSDLILTNTFGANRYKLARHGLEDKLVEINAAGVDLAKRVVAASFKPVLVAGDVGPLGVRLAPFGRVQPEEACAIFREQINALAGAGIDLLVIETLSDLYEMRDIGYDHIYDVPLLSGSFMFCRTDLLRKLSGFNPKYFLYFEDFDLCRRVQKTHRTVYNPHASVIHFWKRDAHLNWVSTYYFMRSAFLYFNRWGYKFL